MIESVRTSTSTPDIKQPDPVTLEGWQVGYFAIRIDDAIKMIRQVSQNLHPTLAILLSAHARNLEGLLAHLKPKQPEAIEINGA